MFQIGHFDVHSDLKEYVINCNHNSKAFGSFNFHILVSFHPYFSDSEENGNDNALSNDYPYSGQISLQWLKKN